MVVERSTDESGFRSGLPEINIRGRVNLAFHRGKVTDRFTGMTDEGRFAAYSIPDKSKLKR
jgi:hypothetical protein